MSSKREPALERQSRVQEQNRSPEDERGSKPPRIFTRDWWKLVGVIAVQSSKDLMRDNAPQWAAAISYYGLLSVFPLMLALASIGSIFVSQDWVVEQGAQILGGFLPDGEHEVERIISEVLQARGGIGFVSIVFLLWSGSRVFGVLTRALNIAYDVDEMYGFFHRTLIELLMLFSIGLLFVAALVSRVVIGAILINSGISASEQGVMFNFAIAALPIGFLFITFFLMYLFVPRRKVSWKAALVGTSFTTTAFAVGRPAFWWYLNSFADYELVYGSIAVMVVLVFWAWLVSLFILIGGEITGHVQDIVIEGKSPDEVARAHQIRSPFSKTTELKNLLADKYNSLVGEDQNADAGLSEDDDRPSIAPPDKQGQVQGQVPSASDYSNGLEKLSTFPGSSRAAAAAAISTAAAGLISILGIAVMLRASRMDKPLYNPDEQI
jgi:membrane protein